MCLHTPIPPQHKSLYVSSDVRVRQVDLFMCHGRYDNCLRCSHDPYCGWDKDANMCKPYKPGYVWGGMLVYAGVCYEQYCQLLFINIASYA